MQALYALPESKKLLNVLVLPFPQAFVCRTLPRLIDFPQHFDKHLIDAALVGYNFSTGFEKLQRLLLGQLVPNVIA